MDRTCTANDAPQPEAAKRRKQITLTLTQSCNLNCVYCFEANKSGRRMTFETAKRILDTELCDKAFDEYEIDFFGGEPFIEFELIKQCFDYVCSTYPHTPLIFTATTNGTLIHGEIKEWLRKNAGHFWCALSLDGTKRMHDINRCNSYDKIDTEFFRTTWPAQPVKMTVSRQSLPYLAEGVIFLHEQGFEFTANLALDFDWSDTACRDILERELMKLIDYYLAHPDVKVSSFLELPIARICDSDVGAGFRQCGAGVEMVSYDTDGTAYPCQFFMPLSVGEEHAAAGKNIVFPDRVYPSDFDEKCRNCKALILCHTCYGANFASTGSIFRKDEHWCELQKIIFRANAFFRMRQVENGTLERFIAPEDMHATLEAILLLLKDF